MALINSPVLPTQASEALKAPMTSSGGQEPVSPDAFSQTLRQQMAQAQPAAPKDKPAAPKAESNTEQGAVSNKASEPTEPAEPADKATAATGTEVAPTEKNIPHLAGKTKAKSKADENTSLANNVAKEPSSVVSPVVGVIDRASLTDANPDQKKTGVGTTEDTSAAAAGIMPWMQTMLAMRANQPAEAAKGGAEGVALTLSNGRFAAAGFDKASSQHGITNELQITPATDKDTLTAATAVVPDGKQLSSLSTKSEKTAEGFTALLNNAKLTSAEIGLPKGMEQAVRAHETTQGASTLTTPPMIETMQNTPWLQSAGVTDLSQVVTTQITTPFTDDRWQAAINQHVMQMASQSDEVASLTLSPPDLGPIQVVLKVDNQSVNPSFITDNPLVRQALEDGMQDLRDRMQSQGLQLGQTFVGNGQQAQQHFEQQSSRDSARTAAPAAESDTAIAPQTAVQPRVVRGLVDTFV
ncbi:flagellar hook-length control protein FliK [Methylophilus sp. YYY-1]|uniref:flagellar hook-length control protein FliK n=1 Tax=Methylophilus sp. YYY-1 TaxID=2682087 RepID=UPI0023B34EB2|nr:flagellar hook-length control protein FliK [Methylophilus sp. YYY-1]MDF0376660.1 flagellar hook-length control protein FliK [Methylophilus sp. YYY-1]